MRKMVETGPRKNWKVFLIGSWCLIFISYFLTWLAYYPGIAAYDANIQVKYAMENCYSTHHPVLHSLYLGELYKLGVMSGNAAMGINWYCFSQMLIVSVSFAVVLTNLWKDGVKIWKCTLCLLFYAFFPVNSILSVSTTKDVLFSVMVLLFLVSLMNMLKQWDEEDAAVGKGRVVGYAIATIGMLLLRNNALYTWLVSVLLWGFLVKKKRKFWVTHIVIGMFFFLMSSGLNVMTGAEKASPVEFLSVPAQQMARVGYYHEEALENSDLEIYIPKDTIRNYDPYLADNIKFYMNADNVRGNKTGFIKTWIELGICYPKDYLDAWLYNTIGYWYIGDKSHSRIYGEREGFGYLMDARFSYDGKPIGVEHSYFPALKAWYHRLFIKNEYQKIPVLQWIFAPGFWVWSLLLTGGFLFVKKDKELRMPVIFLLVYVGTLLLGPCCLVRYVYPLIVSIPWLWCKMGRPRNNT